MTLKRKVQVRRGRVHVGRSEARRLLREGY